MKKLSHQLLVKIGRFTFSVSSVKAQRDIVQGIICIGGIACEQSLNVLGSVEKAAEQLCIMTFTLTTKWNLTPGCTYSVT